MADQLIEVPQGTITTPRGFAAAAVAAAIRDDTGPGHLDLALLSSERRCAAAAVYTANRLQAPPLRITRRHLADGHAQAVIVNTGIANSLTGAQGERDAQEMAELAAAKLGVPVEDVVVASTGVTGWMLPMDRVRSAVPGIAVSGDGGDTFAHAIMTTDTVAKQTAVQFDWDGVRYTVAGAAKGSGMIDVKLATMLAFFTTDAAVAPAALQTLLADTVDASLNMLTIDNAQSTNDMALLLANGAAGGNEMAEGHPALPLLAAALEQVATTLTRKLARDGEGASKLLEVHVGGAATLQDARLAAKEIAKSMLLKAAIFGADPNWGRVLDSIGYCGIDVEEAQLTLVLQGVEVFRKGEPVPFEDAELREALAAPEVDVHVDLGAGEEHATAWGCDLTPEYVRINSEFTT